MPKRIRYIHQPNDWTCSPVALINAMKWSGQQVTLRDLPKIVEECECNKEDGTDTDVFSRKLKQKCNVGRVYIKPHISILDAHLAKGGAAAIRYSWYDGKELFGHIAIVIDKYKGSFVVCNTQGFTILLVTRKEFLRYCWTSVKGKPIKIWLLKR